MKAEALAGLPDWPALMDLDTAIAYLGGSRQSLEELEQWGYLERYANGFKSVRFLRSHIDTALTACALDDEREEKRTARRISKSKGSPVT